MLDITVQREAGDVPSTDLVEPLLGSVPAALSRGRAEIDAAHSVYKLKLTTTFQGLVRLGQLVDVEDSLRGHISRGKVVGIEHVAAEGALLSHLDLEVPL